MTNGNVDSSSSDSYDSDIRAIKAEVDALQVHVMAARRPWYRQVSGLVAVIALIFSLVTTVLSFMRTAEQDVRAQQIEVRSLIQRLMALPKENIDLLTKYEDSPEVSTVLSSSVSIENEVLLQHAVSIVEQIPDLISPVEYFAIAESFFAAGKYFGARRYYEKSLNVAVDREIGVGAYRSLAVLAYQAGEFEEAGRMIDGALGIFESDKFKHIESPPLQYRNWTHFQTRIFWAQKLIQLGANCQEVRRHTAEARKLMVAMPSNPVTQTADDSLTNIEGIIANCSPY